MAGVDFSCHVQEQWRGRVMSQPAVTLLVKEVCLRLSTHLISNSHALTNFVPASLTCTSVYTLYRHAAILVGP